MSNLQVFNNAEFGSVRSLMVNGEPYFVGKDVTDILGYSNSRKAIGDHVDEEDKGVTKCDTLGGVQDMVIINESGLYSLILSSQLPAAKRFKRWITGEVIPSIRKNGGYIAGQESMSPEQIVAQALVVAQQIIADRDKQIEAMRPKALFADAVSASDSAILMRELAKLLKQNGVDTGEKRLWKWMREHGYVIKGTTQPTQKAMELGLFEIVERSVLRSDMDPLVVSTTKVTGKGQQYFINKFLG